MSGQSDQANLAKTGTGGMVSGNGDNGGAAASSAQQSAGNTGGNVPNTGKLNDGSTVHANLRDGSADNVSDQQRAADRATREQAAARAMGNAADANANTSLSGTGDPVTDRKGQIERAQQELEKKSSDNEAGHEKVMQQQEKVAEQAQEASKEPTSGMQNDVLTPTVDKAGNKHWS